MEKAIYGLAIPFSDYHWKHDESSNTYTFFKAQIDSVTFDGVVGATILHDFSQGLGNTRENLSLYINDKGVYFKLIPDSPLGLDSYERVKNGDLQQCSTSFAIREKSRNYAAELLGMRIADAIDSKNKFEFYDYNKILLYELCLTNTPAIKSTFCTTDINHELLKGIDWDNPTAIIPDGSYPSLVTDEFYNKLQELKRETVELKQS